MISEALKHEKFEFDVLRGIQNDLFSYINSMCTGPVSLGDREQVGSREIEQIKLKFKSIDTEIIRRIVDSNRPQTTGQDRRNFVSNRLISQHKIMPRNLTDEMKHEIHELLDEYNGLDDNDLKITYLQNFNGYSCRYDLYRDSIFIEFLEDQIKNGTDKHIILEEIKNLVPNQQLCEMYWLRIVRQIKGRDIGNNRLANSIDAFNNKKCRLRPEWRKGLITHDEYLDLKNETLKLIHYSSQL